MATLAKPIGSYAIQFIIPRFLDDGTVELAVMKYTKNYGTPRAYTTIRLPTETGVGSESYAKTLSRGAVTEIAQDPSNFKVSLLQMMPICAEFLPDQNNPECSHVKMAVVFDYKSGELRNYPKPDDEDPDEYHGPMMWVEVRKLLTEKVEGYKMIFAHRKSVVAFLRFIAERLPEVAIQYYPIIGSSEYEDMKLSRDEYFTLQAFLPINR